MMLQKIKQDEYFDANQVAMILGVNPVTVRRWAHSGKIPFIQLPGGRLRYARSDIEAMLIPTSGSVARGGVEGVEDQQESITAQDVPLPGLGVV